MFSSVRFRLMALVALSFLAILAVVAVLSLGLRNLGDLQDATYQRSQTATQAMEASRLGAQFYRIIGDAIINRDLPTAQRDFAALKHEAEADLARLAADADTTAERAAVADGQAAIDAIVKLFEARLIPALRDASPVDDQVRQIDAAIDTQVIAVRSALKQMAESMQTEAVEADRAFDSTRAETIRNSIILGVIVALALALISAAITRNILRSLNQARGITERIAGGDLSGKVETRGKDEFSAMLASCANMQSWLREIVSDLQDDARQITAMSEELAATTEQVAAATDTQSQSASAMAASVEEMSVSISHVSDRASDVRVAALRSGEVSKQGNAVILDLLAGNADTSSAVEGAATRIQELGRLSEEISSIVNVIREVADQTNLLALNAAIEAARAGEQGRGFAVVADEVRKLAERTGQSTQDITRMIGEIQSVTRNVVASMEAAVQKVHGGNELSQRAHGSIAEIMQQSQHVEVSVEEITEALREQSAASNDIAQRVEQIAVASEQNSAAVRSSAEAARNLEGVSLRLRQATARFRLV